MDIFYMILSLVLAILSIYIAYSVYTLKKTKNYIIFSLL